MSLPWGVAVLPDDRIVVVDKGNNRIRAISVDTRTVSTLAGAGEPGSADGTLATATFASARQVAVDNTGRVVVLQTTGQLRVIEPASDTVRTIDHGDAAVLGSSAAIAIATRGDLLISNPQKGIFVVTNAGLAAGYFAAWSNSTTVGWWSPSSDRGRGHSLCSAAGKEAVWAVLSVAARTHWQQWHAPVGDTTRKCVTAAVAYPALPLELWHLILERTKTWELGGG
jgi:hypothetical protein